MNFKRLLTSLTLLVTSNVIAIPYTSTFIDNGNITTETRTDNNGLITKWEWLDLTITNGISYNSMVDDLADDGLLNISNISTLNLNSGSINDVNSLIGSERNNWEVASHDNLVDLINAFFNIELNPGRALVTINNVITTTKVDWYNFNDNVVRVEEFIQMFGDTFHEGYEDLNNTPLFDYDVSKPNIAFTRGFVTNSLGNPVDARINDGQFANEKDDLRNDYIYVGALFDANEAKKAFGTFLARPVAVAEPTTLVLFTLAFTGLLIRLPRKVSI